MNFTPIKLKRYRLSTSKPVAVISATRNLDLLHRIAHMIDLNNIRVPLIKTKPKLKPDPSKIPEANDPNSYCMSCNFTFKYRSGYRSHLVSVHHMPRPKSSIPHNPKNMKPTIGILSLYCDACLKTYIRHLVRFHGMILPDVYSEPSNFDSSRLYCKVCDITFRKKHHFSLHLRRIHPTALTACPDVITNINDQNNYCTECDIMRCSRYSYLKHLTFLHLEENPELYQGIDCNNPSKEDVRLKKYCADCHKVFLQKILYHIHLDKIHGIKPFECFPAAGDPDVNNPNNHCNLCDKTFRRKNVYRKHMIEMHNMLVASGRIIINQNTTPVMDLLKKYCNACDRVYKTTRTYQCHLSIYHHIKSDRPKSLSNCVNCNEIPVIDEIDNVCTACDKTYADRRSYKTHLYSIHGISLPRPNCKALQINRNIIPDFNDKKKSLCLLQ